ncbi:hypothetical protein Ciccas_010396 [Cichlidogyrus casuarinus]|uniref:Uncharacterized protein n=1 Tax=Cichlidogyrus casuarinus TaxID=1844966 RepID=A0ABD2PUK5_9PLAT
MIRSAVESEEARQRSQNETIPIDNELNKVWADLFGKKLVAFLWSENNGEREEGLAKAKEKTLQFLKPHLDVPSDDAKTYVKCLFNMVHHFLDDVSDRLFNTAIGCCRDVLNNLFCANLDERSQFQHSLYPIMRRLIRISGGNLLATVPNPVEELSFYDYDPLSSFRSAMAFKTLVQFSCGQEGEMRLGLYREPNPNRMDSISVMDRKMMAQFILRSETQKFHKTHLIGRLRLLDKIIGMELRYRGFEGPTVPPSCSQYLTVDIMLRSLVFASRHVYKPNSLERLGLAPEHHLSFSQFCKFSVQWVSLFSLHAIKK